MVSVFESFFLEEKFDDAFSFFLDTLICDTGAVSALLNKVSDDCLKLFNIVLFDEEGTAKVWILGPNFCGARLGLALLRTSESAKEAADEAASLKLLALAYGDTNTGCAPNKPNVANPWLGIDCVGEIETSSIRLSSTDDKEEELETESERLFDFISPPIFSVETVAVVLIDSTQLFPVSMIFLDFLLTCPESDEIYEVRVEEDRAFGKSIFKLLLRVVEDSTRFVLELEFGSEL